MAPFLPTFGVREMDKKMLTGAAMTMAAVVVTLVVLHYIAPAAIKKHTGTA